MTPISVEEVRRLLDPQQPPCVSLYMPTHRRYAEGQQDPIRFRGLLGRAAELLRTDRSADEIKTLLSPLESLDHPDFWRYQYGGLAVLRSPERFVCYRLPMTLEELVVVSGTFHTRPLIRYLRTNRRFYVLALARNAVTLYEGTPYALERLNLRELPTSLRDALGVEEPIGHLDFHSTAAGGRNAVYHGHGAGNEDRKDEILRYFRAVDRALWEFLRADRVPLVIAGVGYYHPIYREVSRYEHLLAGGVEGNVERESPEAIHAKAWPLVSAWAAEQETQIVDLYGASRAAEKASDDLSAIGLAVIEGRVATLLLAEGSHVWGRVDPVSGQVEAHTAQRDTDDADVLDDLGEMTLLRGGEVRTLVPERMPTSSPAAAIFRY